jgi:hypothetical protein
MKESSITNYVVVLILTKIQKQGLCESEHILLAALRVEQEIGAIALG